MINLNFLPTHCAVCGKILIAGRFGVDLWGNIFCEAHRHEYHACTACHRLVCPRLTHGGLTYPDGRLVCNLCRATAVDTKEQAKPIVEMLANWLHERGVRFEGLILKIDLQDIQEMAAQHIVKRINQDHSSPTGIGQGLLMGYIMKTTEHHGKQEKRKVKGVTILPGLPRELFEGITVHELGHAWLYLAHVDNLPTWQEEGFCNLLSYILHKDRPTPEGIYYTKLLEEDPNPIYGEGFRRIRDIFKKHGFGEALNYTFYKRKMPE